MKRNEWMALIVTSFLMLAICMSASANTYNNNKTVERGMTKRAVMHLLGKPKMRSFDATGDRWEYVKNELSPFKPTELITVVFDRNEQVVAYYSRTPDSNTNRPLYPILPPYGDDILPDGTAHYNGPLSDDAFNVLYGKVQKASFADNKLDLLEVACLGCNFSCAQTARIIKLLSFSSDQLKALSLMAPYIVDPQNAIDIYNVFSFESDKQKAAEIITISTSQANRAY